MHTVRDTRYTVDDYMALPEGFPAQLVEGGFVKEPAPTFWHQRIVLELARRLAAAAGAERVLVAPADVILDPWNVFQPDVLAFREGLSVSPATRRTEIPVLVAEVHSPGTEARDRDVKAAKYLAGGVLEVWLVDPRTGTIEVRTARGATVRGPGEEAASEAVPGFRTSWRELAGEPEGPPSGRA